MSNDDWIAAFKLRTRDMRRVGYGGMQLVGNDVFGPPRDRASALPAA